MTNATNPGGRLIPLDKCFIAIPGYQPIELFSLPEISDSKSASYNDEGVNGRATPLTTFSYSEPRVISMKIHFYTITASDPLNNLLMMRSLQSCVYPRDQDSGINAPYLPPFVCQIKCGSLLGDNPLCVSMMSYNTNFPTDVPWDPETYLPYKFDMDITWKVVYNSLNLPGQNRIATLGV